MVLHWAACWADKKELQMAALMAEPMVDSSDGPRAETKVGLLEMLMVEQLVAWLALHLAAYWAVKMGMI